VAKHKLLSKDEVVRVLMLLLVFTAVLGGRELGNYYAKFESITKMKILFEVTEEETHRWMTRLLAGEDAWLNFGLILADLRMENPAEHVTNTPDYVKRWWIGLTVSPVLVNQPEISDIEVNIFIEDTLIDGSIHHFPKEKISYIYYMYRALRLNMEDSEELKKAVHDASKRYGGEVAVTFKGRGHVRLLFLDTWLPFEVTRYPFVEAPHLEYMGSGWRNNIGERVSNLSVDEEGYVLVKYWNPTRMHSLRENTTCIITREGDMSPVLSVTKQVRVWPGSAAQYIFPFNLTEPGKYSYRVVSQGRILFESGFTLRIE